MTIQSPVTPLLPKDGGFGLLRDEIASAAESMRAARPESDRLSVNEEYAMSRKASGGVLRILEKQGVVEAGTLLKELEAEAEREPLTNLATIAARHEHMDMLDGSDDSRDMARLALAVDGTGQAAIAAVLGRSAALSSMRRARQEVLAYDDLEGSIAGDTLHVLLDEVERVPLPAQPESLAA